MTYQPYPRRLYLHGEVIPGDLHATNSVVVGDEQQEAEARANGYAKAWEVIEKKDIGGNGGSPAEAVRLSAPHQDDVAVVSAGPTLDELREQAKALGIKVDRRWKEARLQEEIESREPRTA